MLTLTLTQILKLISYMTVVFVDGFPV